MTPEDIEERLLTLLKQNRPGTDVRGTHSHLEVYDRLIQKEILEPLLKERAAAGLVAKIDDLGNDMSFVSAWNRALDGKSMDWDCRQLAQPFVR